MRSFAEHGLGLLHQHVHALGLADQAREAGQAHQAQAREDRAGPVEHHQRRVTPEPPPQEVPGSPRQAALHLEVAVDVARDEADEEIHGPEKAGAPHGDEPEALLRHGPSQRVRQRDGVEQKQDGAERLVHCPARSIRAPRDRPAIRSLLALAVPIEVDLRPRRRRPDICALLDQAGALVLVPLFGEHFREACRPHVVAQRAGHRLHAHRIRACVVKGGRVAVKNVRAPPRLLRLVGLVGILHDLRPPLELGDRRLRVTGSQ
mmetsp:Transcript_55956/g.170350  ORF Transcript_55956/g.170350 Transcript_55956/m.170350 type:complete len:262 (+) Transcript_55956:1932-2717(+)